MRRERRLGKWVSVNVRRDGPAGSADLLWTHWQVCRHIHRATVDLCPFAGAATCTRVHLKDWQTWPRSDMFSHARAQKMPEGEPASEPKVCKQDFCFDKSISAVVSGLFIDHSDRLHSHFCFRQSSCAELQAHYKLQSEHLWFRSFQRVPSFFFFFFPQYRM